MLEQEVTLQPGESKVVSFITIPEEAKLYHVAVNGLTGSFNATKPELSLEVLRVTLNGVGGDPINSAEDSIIYGLYQVASPVTKREADQGDLSMQRFGFNVRYRNKLSFDVFLHPFFAFGIWSDHLFTPYSPQDSIIEARPPEYEQYYAMKDDYIRLGGMESAFTARNMSNKISDTLYMSHAYLKVPAGGTAETGFDNIHINSHARSISAFTQNEASVEYCPGPPCLALKITMITKHGSSSWYISPRQALPPLDLDVALRTKVYRYQPPEEYDGVYGRLIDVGIIDEVWGVLLGATHMTNAWGKWSAFVQGYTHYYEWQWVCPDTYTPEPGRDQRFTLCEPPDWWE